MTFASWLINQTKTNYLHRQYLY